MNKEVLWSAFTYGFTEKQLAKTVTLIWRLLVTGHILWVCGFLAVVGLASPFVRLEAVEPITEQVAELTDTIKLTTKLALLRELRVQQDIYCATPDTRLKAGIQYTIDRLKEDYRKLMGVEPTLEPCHGI